MTLISFDFYELHPFAVPLILNELVSPINGTYNCKSNVTPNRNQLQRLKYIVQYILWKCYFFPVPLLRSSYTSKWLFRFSMFLLLSLMAKQYRNADRAGIIINLVLSISDMMTGILLMVLGISNSQSKWRLPCHIQAGLIIFPSGII